MTASTAVEGERAVLKRPGTSVGRLAATAARSVSGEQSQPCAFVSGGSQLDGHERQHRRSPVNLSAVNAADRRRRPLTPQLVDRPLGSSPFPPFVW